MGLNPCLVYDGFFPKVIVDKNGFPMTFQKTFSQVGSVRLDKPEGWAPPAWEPPSNFAKDAF